MFNKENKPEWILLFGLGVILFFLYGFNLREMFKRILEWGFALIGFRLLIEYGILEKLKTERRHNNG